jgi:hypothetical protein
VREGGVKLTGHQHRKNRYVRLRFLSPENAIPLSSKIPLSPVRAHSGRCLQMRLFSKADIHRECLSSMNVATCEGTLLT